MNTITQLHSLNFADLLVLDCPAVADYGFAAYRANGYRHPKTHGFCVECERKGYNNSPSKTGFSLKNMSHGAHSLDFLAAVKDTVGLNQWHEEPVLFVFEAPSKDYGIYEEAEFEAFKKRPTKEWSWVHYDQKETRFPANFNGREYGGLFLSIMFTFRLKNAYMTNLVKCGMNSEDGQDFQPGLRAFQPDCVRTCMGRYLMREIEALNPKLVFTFGADVYGQVLSLVGKGLSTYQLPHPARGRGGFKNSYFRVLYFWLIALALQRTGIIQSAEIDELAKSFVRDYEEP